MPITLQDVRYPHRVEVPLQSALVLQNDGTLNPQPTPNSVAALASDQIVLEFYPGETLWGVKVLSADFTPLLGGLPVIDSADLWSTLRGQVIAALGKDYRLQVTGTALRGVELARQVTIELILVPDAILVALQRRSV